MSWKSEKIEKLFTIGRGRVINEVEIKNNPGDYPVYSSQTSNNGEFGKVNFFEFSGDYITWTTDGANAGKVFYRSGRFNCTNVCGTLKSKYENKIDTKYFAYLIDRHAFRHVAIVGNNKLMNNVMGKIKIYFPEEKLEQTAIASILTKVDYAIYATQNMIKAAEKLKKALMQNLLTGKLKFDGTWRTAEEFEMTKIGLIPKEWLVKTVKEISTQVTDGEHTTPERSDKGFFLLSARNIKNSYLDLSDVDYVPEKELRKIQKRCNPESGDILISCSGTIGNVCIVPEGLDAGMVRSAALVKLKKEDIEPSFAELIFQSFSLQNQMKVSVASSVQGNIFQGAIKKLRIPYPPSKTERDAITIKIKGISESIITKQKKIQALKRLKKSLMQNLLTGKVQLSQELIEKLSKERMPD